MDWLVASLENSQLSGRTSTDVTEGHRENPMGATIIHLCARIYRMSVNKPKSPFCGSVFILSILSIHVKTSFRFAFLYVHLRHLWIVPFLV